ncbi:MAG: hypothetical protein L3K11_03745 [Thermoplasmata archaeon]|nr:hypothetical protein [Thermoplasmata archaeon]
MPPAKRPLITANVDPQTLERLKERAAERGVSLREYCSDALSSACQLLTEVERRTLDERSIERSNERVAERSAQTWPECVPVLLRLKDDAEAGPTDPEIEAAVPPICGDGAPEVEGTFDLPEDPTEAAVIFARELQLVRRSTFWRDAVQEGLFNEELARPSRPRRGSLLLAPVNE